MREMNGFQDMTDLRRFGMTLAASECTRTPLVCPKPRRIAVINHVAGGDPVRPCRRHLIESEAGSELLDIIFAKGTYGGDQSASGSPPYFCGSPPSRTANPLVHDIRFAERRADVIPALVPVPVSFSANPASSPPLSPPPSFSGSSVSARKGCATASFDHKPAAVRIEGFDCLDRDRRGCSISAMA